MDTLTSSPSSPGERSNGHHAVNRSTCSAIEYELFPSSDQLDAILHRFTFCQSASEMLSKDNLDVNAMVHMLEQKQGDLKLAAEIGQYLLAKQAELTERLKEADDKLTNAEDVIGQLRHTLIIKDNLLASYARDFSLEEDDRTSMLSDPISPGAGTLSDSGAVVSLPSQVNAVTRKLREMEEENILLRQEHQRLYNMNYQPDTNQHTLVRNCVQEMTATNVHMRTLSEELFKRSDALQSQQNEITRLLTRNIDLEIRTKQLLVENEMLADRLVESQTTQKTLTVELGALRDKYDECLALYNEARNEVRRLRKRNRRVNVRPTMHTGTGHPGSPSVPIGEVKLDSLIRHIADSELSSSSPESTLYIPAFGRGLATQHSLASELLLTGEKTPEKHNLRRLLTFDGKMTHTPWRTTRDDIVISSGFVSATEPSFPLSVNVNATVHSQCGDVRADSSHLLSADLRRTSSLPDDGISKLHFGSQQGSVMNRQYTANEHRCVTGTTTSHLPSRPTVQSDECGGTSTDVSILQDTSTPNTSAGLYTNAHHIRTRQRLQLIKPLDGSEVLQQWQRLATPDFTQALFADPLPGVQSRAAVSLPQASPSTQADKSSISKQQVVMNLPSWLVTPSNRTAVFFRKSMRSDTKSLHRLSDPFADRETLDRFGGNLSSSLTRASARGSATTRSFDNLSDSSEPVHESIHDPPVAATSSGFSLASLVSSLLPFASPLGSPQMTSKEEGVSDVSTQPNVIRRPRHQTCSRVSRPLGLLEVSSLINLSTQVSSHQSTEKAFPPSAPSLPSGRNQLEVVSHPRRQHSRVLKTGSLNDIEEEERTPPPKTSVNE